MKDRFLDNRGLEPPNPMIRTLEALESRNLLPGAPEDIVLHPRTPYVAEFVARLNPLSVLRATDVMGPATTPADPNRTVTPTTPLRDTLPLFAAADAPVWVVEDGATRGTITPDAVFRVLSPRGEEG